MGQQRAKPASLESPQLVAAARWRRPTVEQRAGVRERARDVVGPRARRFSHRVV
jgi:hypothetical protein